MELLNEAIHWAWAFTSAIPEWNRLSAEFKYAADVDTEDEKKERITHIIWADNVFLFANTSRIDAKHGV